MRRRLINEEVPKRQNALLEQPKGRLVIRRGTPNEEARTEQGPLLGGASQKTRYWTEPRPCMVLGLKPLGKPATSDQKLSVRQNLGIAWSSDSSLWGN